MRLIAFLLAPLALVAAPAWADDPSHPDLSGFWNLDFGPPGPDGKAMVDALPPAERGPPGERGPEGRLPVAKQWADGVHYAGEIVIHEGSTYQAGKDTGRSPPHEDWSCIARAGADGATFAITVTHGDTVNSTSNPTSITDGAAADAASLVGTLADAGFAGTNDKSTRKVGYNPGKGAGKRYVQFTVTPTGNTGNAPLAALFVLKPQFLPAA